jgi:hypothetical protein
MGDMSTILLLIFAAAACWLVKVEADNFEGPQNPKR